jgi:isohexenylglutaconyl-CoA hydratase
MGDTSASDVVEVRREGGWLHVTLNRPERRNAMNMAMVDALERIFGEVEGDHSVRAVVLRGAGGHFCAGGDIADMGSRASEGPAAIAAMNRRFGAIAEAADASRAAVVAVCEGAVMGGGFGLACVSDVAIATDTARFRLPETSLGVIPAQIAPFIVQRVGLSQARRLAVTGETLSATDALALGLVHHRCADAAEADAKLADVLKQVRRCEPGALAATKALVRRVGGLTLGPALDAAAAEFAAFAQRPEAAAGMQAFLTRSAAPWDRDSTEAEDGEAT